MRHTKTSMYLSGWIEKCLGTRVKNGFDRIRHGKFPEDLVRKVSDSRNFLVILTPETFGQKDDDNNWMVDEIETALKAKANIIPIVTPDFVWPKILPDRIKEIQYYETVVMNLGNG